MLNNLPRVTQHLKLRTSWQCSIKPRSLYDDVENGGSMLLTPVGGREASVMDTQ